MRLKESTAVSRGQRIDLERGIVPGVKILGLRSAHGYDYTPTAMRGAVGLYEGVAVNVDHPAARNPDQSRKYADRFGRIRNVRFVEGRGLIGDLHYNRNHSIAKQFEWDVEHEPKNVGLSHNADADVEKRNGRFCVEQINKVRSVDLVADPATSSSLFEGKGRRMGTFVRRKKKTVQEGRGVVRKVKSARRKLLEDLQAEELAETTVEKTTDEALADLLSKLARDTKLTPSQKKAKTVALFDAMAAGDVTDETTGENAEELEVAGAVREGLGDPDEDDEDDDDEDEELGRTGRGSRAVLESKILALEARQEVRELCEDLGFRPSAVQVTALVGLKTTKQRKALIEGMGGQRPETGRFDSAPAKSGKPRNESEGSKDPKEWLSGICS